MNAVLLCEDEGDDPLWKRRLSMASLEAKLAFNLRIIGIKEERDLENDLNNGDV